MSLEKDVTGSMASLQAAGRNAGDVSRWLRDRDISSLREHLYHYRPILRAMAAKYGGAIPRCTVDRSDVVQDTLHDAVRGLEGVKAVSSPQFFAWLTTLLKNRIRMSIRRYRSLRRHGEMQQSVGRFTESIPLERVDAAPLPDEEMLELENLERLSRVVSRLPDELKLLLKWRFEEGMTFKEISVKVDRTPDAVRMLLNRCLSRIREEYCGSAE